MKVIDCVQGTEEWLSARLGIPTASCFQDILAQPKDKAAKESAGRRNYRLKLVLERLTGKVAEGYTNGAMQQGNEREAMGRSLFETRGKCFVEQIGFCRHDVFEAGASPDGLIDDDAGFELKCPEPAAHLDYLHLGQGEVPFKYKAQVQGNMWITGRQRWAFCSYNPDFPEHLQLVERWIGRDDVYIKQLEFQVLMFLSEIADEESALRSLRP